MSYLPLLQVRNPLHLLLRVANHLDEEICKRRPAQLRRLAAVQVAVVDGLLVGRVAQGGRRLAGEGAGCLGEWRLLHCALRRGRVWFGSHGVGVGWRRYGWSVFCDSVVWLGEG